MNIRQSLLDVGFRWEQPLSRTLYNIPKSVRGSRFVKRYDTTSGEFEVVLFLQQQDLTRLPRAYVTIKPKHFNGIALPHIRNDGYLCYADNDQSEWNPLDPFSFAHSINRSITKTLQRSIDTKDHSDEYRNEFTNYWESFCVAYSFNAFPTTVKELRYTSLFAKNGSSIESYPEYVIYSSDAERKSWLDLRNVTSAIEDGVAVVITVKPNLWAPTSSWPPSSLAEVVKWLAKADRSAHDNLIYQLVKQSTKRILVVLQLTNEGLLGFKIEFSERYKKLLMSWKIRNKKSIKSMIAPICSPKATELFYRHRIEPIDRDAIFLRNRPNPEIGDIRDKRIALIGCGTIGGYIADHLVKMGAGAGLKGSLTLYDSDSLSSGNLSRHRLPANYLGWNKADALATLLKSEVLHPASINIEKLDFDISVENLSRFEVIIDATGRVPVSKVLAQTIRTIQTNRPILIHGLNDRWGQESVVFIDNGKACYGCLDRLKAGKKDGADKNASRFSCGSVYTPYDANVSTISASLVVEAVLSTLEPKLKWTLTKVTSDITKSQKRYELKAWTGCSICSKGTKT